MGILFYNDRLALVYRESRQKWFGCGIILVNRDMPVGVCASLKGMSLPIPCRAPVPAVDFGSTAIGAPEETNIETNSGEWSCPDTATGVTPARVSEEDYCCFHSQSSSDVCGTCMSNNDPGAWCGSSESRCQDHCGGTHCKSSTPFSPSASPSPPAPFAKSVSGVTSLVSGELPPISGVSSTVSGVSPSSVASPEAHRCCRGGRRMGCSSPELKCLPSGHSCSSSEDTCLISCGRTDYCPISSLPLALQETVSRLVPMVDEFQAQTSLRQDLFMEVIEVEPGFEVEVSPVLTTESENYCGNYMAESACYTMCW